MTDQERKERILTKLRNIVFLLLGITVVFISIASIVSNTAFGNIVSNALWIVLALILIVQAFISIYQSFRPLASKAKIFLLTDWATILLGILLGNGAYLMKNNLWLIIGIAIFIAGCIPIKDKK
ncbi:hypothetical protein ODV12_08060 [Lactobacillus amylovorus]|uniref:hypothetical protein n=1 Tax=Lactobacillus amylovorus TaxID=1604 RepID=UPI00232E4BE6|nr:hypothetical protein [Lactobacillus amylovorus]MDB6251178.1 hypothetical protein [Lactobacillus amylovorus]